MKKPRRKALQIAALHMEQGVRPSLAMTRCQAFPALACRLIEAGEQTGSLDTLCHVLADFYTRAKGTESFALESGDRYLPGYTV